MDYIKIYGLLSDLDTKGTAEVKVSRIHTLLNGKANLAPPIERYAKFTDHFQ